MGSLAGSIYDLGHQIRNIEDYVLDELVWGHPGMSTEYMRVWPQIAG
jgi:hypothetical protein